MAVLINKQTGLAEDLDPKQAQALIQQGAYELPLVSPEGTVGSAGHADAPGLLQQGFRQPSAEELTSLLRKAKHSTVNEQIKTGVEGALKAGTFGLSTGIERAIGIPEEDIRGREEANPGIAALGEAGGLAASMLTGVGEGKLLTQAGSAAERMFGTQAKGLVGKAANAAVRQATEMALFQAGNEVSKAFVNDPNQSAETIAADIALSGLLGGTFGGAGSLAANSLWKVAQGSKLTALVGKLKDQALGHEGMSAVEKAAKESGITLSPEMRATLSGKPLETELAQTLEASASSSANKQRASVELLRKDIQKGALNALGKTEADLGTELSEYEIGKELQQKLVKDLSAKLDPLSKEFENIQGKFSKTALGRDSVASIGEKLGDLGMTEGYNLSAESPALKEIHRIQKDLGNLKTLEDLRKYQAVARENIQASGNYRLARQVSSILRESEQSVIGKLLGEHAPELIEKHEAARLGYGKFMNLVEDLNDRLHVGRYHGPGSFLTALKEMTPEDILRRSRGMKDVEFLTTLGREFPEAAAAIKDYHTKNLLKIASARQADGAINVKTLMNAVERMAPELRDFTLSKEAQASLAGAKDLLDKLPKSINPSGTARGLDKVMKYMPGGVASLLSHLTGHSAIGGFIIGQVGQLIGREAPDAARFALLKALGTEGAVNPVAFKQMVKAVESAQRATKTMEKGVKALFTAGGTTVIDTTVSEKQREKLQKMLLLAKNSPEMFLNHTGELGHYLPDHAIAASAVTTRAASYLDSIKPQTAPQRPLDPQRVPTDIEKAEYNRALDIAENPMMVLSLLKLGTARPQDLKHLSSMYPSLYAKMQQSVFNELTQAKEKGTLIPYKTKASLSMFLGQPLDSSLMPQNIMLNQHAALPPTKQQQSNGGAPGGSKQALKTLPSTYSTTVQAREQRKLTRK